jgi:hypothetical protein
MKIYSPFTLGPEEIDLRSHNTDEPLDLSDDTLRSYVETFLASYRSTLEEFFDAFRAYIPFYAEFPFETKVLRLGTAGAFIGYRPAPTPSITILEPAELEGAAGSLNLFDIQKAWQTPYLAFDLSGRSYGEQRARMEGQSSALTDALAIFWQVVDGQTFELICRDLLKEESLELVNIADTSGDLGYDATATVVIREPAGFRRYEDWAFQLKARGEDRVSVQEIRHLEQAFSEMSAGPDVLCVITSGDLTSIGRNVSVENPRIRIWDRPILDALSNRHVSVFGRYFAAYGIARETLLTRLDEVANQPPTASELESFTRRLEAIPPGRADFRDYEDIGTEIWNYTFEGKLGPGRPQERTIDGKQRRDVLFRNLRASRFFNRIAERYGADLIVVDFKNYTDPVDPDVIDDVCKYANEAIGRLLIVVCRRGMADAARATQVRRFRDQHVLVLPVSDTQMLEMVSRKENRDEPEDVLEDLLDDFLAQY